MSPSYFERPPGERLATLEAQMKTVLSRGERIEAKVDAMHGKIMHRDGITATLRQSGTWVVALIASTLGGLATNFAHRIWG